MPFREGNRLEEILLFNLLKKVKSRDRSEQLGLAGVFGLKSRIFAPL